MSLERLELTPFVVVLRDILTQKRTGSLTVVKQPISKTLFFSQGELVLAVSSAQEDSLAQFLLAKGVATPDQARDLTSVDATEIVSRFNESRLVEPGQRAPLLREWMTAITVPLFSWEEGTAAFNESPAIEPEKRVFLQSTAGWLLDGIRSMTNGLLIRRSLGDLKLVISPSRERQTSMDSLPLNLLEGHIATTLTDPEPIELFLKRFSGDSLGAAKVVIAMMTLGMYTDVQPKPKQRTFSEIDETQQDLELLASIGSGDVRSLAAVRLARQLSRTDYYQLLDIPKAAPRALIMSRGDEIRKKYDPSSYPAAVRDSVHSILRRIDEAVNLLKDPVRRQEYDKLLTGAVRRGDDLTVQQLIARRSIAEQNFRKGEDLATAGDYYGAIVLLKQTVEYVPDHVEAWYILATCQEKNPKWRREAVESYLKAVSLNPNHIEAMIALGDLYKSEGMIARAQSCFEDVLQTEPENARAKHRLKQLKK